MPAPLFLWLYRQQPDGICTLLRQNIPPARQRIAEKAARSPGESFNQVALSCHKSNRTWSQNHSVGLLASINNYLFPKIGHLPVTELQSRHFIDWLKGIEAKGLLEVASCTRQHLSNIMRHAVHQRMIESNPTSEPEGIIVAPVKRHCPAPLNDFPNY